MLLPVLRKSSSVLLQLAKPKKSVARLGGAKMVSKVTALDDFIERTRALLLLEKEEEDERFRVLVEEHSLMELCDAGVALGKMHVVSKRTGFGGRKVVTFAKKLSTTLPNHKLSPGDIVRVAYSGCQEEGLSSGVLCGVGETSVSVACEQWDEEEMDSDNKTFCLVQAVNDVTHRRMMKSLENLEDYSSFHGRSLVEYAFNKRTLPFCADDKEDELEFLDDSLNDAQRVAVKMCCNPSRPISIIHGPPGTGKTRTVVEVVRQCVARNQKILVCAPSNAGVDNVIQRLKETVRLVRLGHPARSHPDVEKYTLDGILNRSDMAQIIQDIRDDMDEVKRGKGRFSEKRSELKDLRKELKMRETQASKGILRSADVVCATLTSADPESRLRVVTERGFDVVVIDECAQGLEVGCWLALVQGKRCVLAGDHCQLAPTILSEKAAKGGLSKTLMGRMEEDFPESRDDILKLLTLQYRMNERIMKWASAQMYNNQLSAAQEASSRTLSDIGSEDVEEVNSVLWLIDTQGCDMPELMTEDEESKGNPGEVLLTYVHVSRLISAGIKEEDIAIISPYNLQVQLLRSHVREIYPKVAIRSVDGFQGQEKEAVILSLVRSNNRGEVGFLNDKKRINVAVTRAKRHLALICDAGTVKSDELIASLIDYISAEGTLCSAFEYQDAIESVPFTIDTSDMKEAADNKPGTRLWTSEKKESPRTKTASHLTLPKSQYPPAGKMDWIKREAPGTAGKENERSLDLEGWEIKLTKDVEEFIDSWELRVEFPSILTPRDRHFLHELAEEKHLDHFSLGEGPERKIVLRKRVKDPELKEGTPTLSEKADSELPRNLDAAAPKTTKKTRNTTQRPKKKEGGTKKREDPSLNEDEFLEQFGKEERRCKYDKCKKGISVLGIKCEYCGRTYCLSHAMAEVHGCGDAAKKEARRGVRRELSGIPPPVNRASDAPRKAHLQKKMEKKMKDMQERRKAKAASKK